MGVLVLVSRAVLLLLPVLGSAADPDLGFDLLMSGVGGGEIMRHALVPDEGAGAIPAWLSGTLVENGGGRFAWPNPSLRRNLTNAGDGYAKLDVFTFADGSCTYTSKFARSAWFNNSVKIDDIAPSLTFGVPAPPRKSDAQGLPNVLAPNDNLAVNVIGIQDRVLMLSDQPGSIEFSLETLEFGKHQSSMPGPLCAFKDEPAIPLGMMASFGSAHPLWTGSSLDSSGDAYGLLNVQRLSTLDPRKEQLRLFKISAADQDKKISGGRNPWLTRKTIATLNMSEGIFSPYMHSFILAGDDPVTRGPTHAVLVQHAMNIAMADVIKGMGKKHISAAFDIDLTRPMIFHVVDLSNGRVEKEIAVNMSEFTAAAANHSMIVSHTVNGYFVEEQQQGQQGGAVKAVTKLIVDVIGYDFLFFNRFAASEINNKTARDHGTYSNSRAKTFRFTLDVQTGVAIAVEELLPKSDWEFPTINEGFKGKPYCYAYGYEFRSDASGNAGGADIPVGVAATGATGMANMAMIKYNVCGGTDKASGKRIGLEFKRPYHYFSEPFFVPRPGSTQEDDGVVLVPALDGATEKGVLYVLDANNLEVLATLRLPVLINLKTHGRFIQRPSNGHSK